MEQFSLLPGSAERLTVRTEESLGLVVVGYESGAEWEPFFHSLTHSTLKPRHVVVVDNSPAETEPVDPALWPDMQVIHLPHNPGYGGAVNKGVTALPAGVSRIVVSNPDIRFQADTLKVLSKAFSTFPETAITGPALENADGSTYPSARAIPGLRIGVGHALLGNLWPSNPWTRKYLGDYRQMSSRPVGWVSGAVFMVDRHRFDSIGGFDGHYFMFFEDIDLCYRLKRAGYRSVYVPAARVLHEGGHSTRERMPEMVRAHHASALRFLNSLYPHPHQAALRLLLRTGLALRSRIQQAKYRRR